MKLDKKLIATIELMISDGIITCEEAGKYFPEFKQNGDEEIRINLIKAFQSMNANEIWHGIKPKDILDWLEKQDKYIGDQFKVLKDHWYVCIRHIPWTDHHYQVGKIYQSINDNWIPDDSGKEHEFCDRNACPPHVWFYEVTDVTNVNKHTDEGEQNSKSEFKVGDWVIYCRETYQISGLKNGSFLLISNKYGYYFLSEESKTCEPSFRHWTIQDAKPGDVLSYRNGQWIFLNKDVLTEDKTIKYYALSSERGLAINDFAFSRLPLCITPATKEQRNLLFQKMERSGYKWNPEKLELSTINKL